MQSYEVISDSDVPQNLNIIGGDINCGTSNVELFGSSSSMDVTITWLGPNNTNFNGASIVVDVPGTYTMNVTDNITGCMSSQNTVVALNQDAPSIEPINEVSLDCKPINFRYCF